MSPDSPRRLWLNCRQATALVLQSPDRPLTRLERLALRTHLWMCKACPRFVQQMNLMQGAWGPWRRYRDAADQDDPPPG